MFKREENPYLFDLIKEWYKKIDWNYYGIKNGVEIKNNQFDDNQLKILKDLRLDVNDNIFKNQGLQGIENFENLEFLHIVLHAGSDIANSFDNCYNFSKNLKNLVELTVDVNKSRLCFDVKNNNITHAFSKDLPFDEIVKNNEQIESKLKATFPDVEYSAVLNLNNAKLHDVIRSINEVCDNVEPIKLQLDMHKYFYLQKNNPDLFDKLNDENCQIFITHETMPLKISQMGELQNNIKSVIKDVTNKDDNDLDKIFKVYQYISKAVKYDNENLDFTRKDESYFYGKVKEDESSKKSLLKERDNIAFYKLRSKRQINKKLNNINEKLNKDKSLFEKSKNIDKKELSERIRSPYYAMLDKKGVCVASSNLFNAFMLEMGYDAKPVYVGSNSNRINHQISKVLLPNNNWYYFDPTWDKGDNPKYFAKTKNEIGAIYKTLDKTEEKVVSGELINSDELYNKNKQDIEMIENSHKSPLRRILDAIHKFTNFVKAPFERVANYVGLNDKNKSEERAK